MMLHIWASDIWASVGFDALAVGKLRSITLSVIK